MLVQDTQKGGGGGAGEKRGKKKARGTIKTHREMVTLLQLRYSMINTLRKGRTKVNNDYKNKNMSYGL